MMSEPSTSNLSDPGAGQAPELPRYAVNLSRLANSSNLFCISFRDNVTVLVTVGEDMAKFYPHKQLLCDGSHFFRTALTGGYKETTEGTYTIHVWSSFTRMPCVLTVMGAFSVKAPAILRDVSLSV